MARTSAAALLKSSCSNVTSADQARATHTVRLVAGPSASFPNVPLACSRNLFRSALSSTLSRPMNVSAVLNWLMALARSASNASRSSAFLAGGSRAGSASRPRMTVEASPNRWAASRNSGRALAASAFCLSCAASRASLSSFDSPAGGMSIRRARFSCSLASSAVSLASASSASTTRGCFGLAMRNPFSPSLASDTMPSRVPSSVSSSDASSRHLARSSGSAALSSSDSGLPSRTFRYSRARSTCPFSRSPRTSSSGDGGWAAAGPAVRATTAKVQSHGRYGPVRSGMSVPCCAGAGAGGCELRFGRFDRRYSSTYVNSDGPAGGVKGLLPRQV